MISAKEVEQIIRNGVPMANDIDLKIDFVESGRALARVPFHANHIRPGGTLSGPVIMALGDAAMYAAILATCGKVEMAVTSNLNINFLQRPEPVDLLAEAVVLKMGKRLAFCEVRLTSAGSEEWVAHVTGSYAMPSSQ